MAVADGVVYVPVANLASEWKTRTTGLGSANFGEGKGEMLALDLASGHVLWDTKLPQMADGDATVVNDLVFTTTFDGYLLALNRNDGSIVWRQKLPAFTNAPVAVDGDTLVTAASFPGGKGQTTEVIAFRLGAQRQHRRRPRRPASPPAVPPTAPPCSRRTAPPATRSPRRTRRARSGPNLDQLKPSERVVERQVTNGGGGMPAFGSRLSAKQIDAIATYVANNAGK